MAFGKYLLLPAIPLFTQRYPDIALEVRFNDRFVDIAAERVDVAVRVGKVRFARHHRQAHFGVAPAHLRVAEIPGAGRACRARPKICASTACIGHLRGDANRPADWQFKHGDGTRTRCVCRWRCRSTPSMRSTTSALDGQGVVQQLDLLVSSYLAEGRLVEVLRELSCEGPPLSVIYPKATQHLAKVRVFAEFAGDLMRNYEARMRRAAEPASR